MRILVITPAFNEQSTIQSVIQDVCVCGFTHLIVDDGSHDLTFEFARQSSAIVLRLPINLGVGGALKCGYRFAVDNGYDAVVQLDADGQHSAGEIHKLLDWSDRFGYDLTIGSRFFDEKSNYSIPIIRRIAMLLLARFASRYSDAPLSDVTSGFRLVKGSLLLEFAEEFPHYYLGDTFEATVIAGRSGYSIGEVPVVMRQRQGGRPSSSLLDSLSMIVKSLVLVCFAPAPTRALRDTQPGDTQ